MMRFFLGFVSTVFMLACVTGQEEGDTCTVVKTGQVGLCLHLAKCPVVLEAVHQGIPPQICGMAGTVAVVCCPRVSVLEGSRCTLIDTTPGVCRPFVNCPRALKAAVRGVLPQKCDLTDKESELVCCAEAACPPLSKGLVTQLPSGSKAADYCIELTQKIHPCQETEPGWTRGNICSNLTPDSNIKYHRTPMRNSTEAPHFGRVGEGETGSITWGWYPVTLVSDQWVVCSAWAISTIRVPFIGLGGLIRPNYIPDEIYEVAEQRIHPLHNASYTAYYNDIALLRLDRRVTFTAFILPACLHTGTPLPDNGFLQTDHIGLKTTVQMVSQEECSNQFPIGSHGHPDGALHDIEMCSRPVNTNGKCLGWDNGSPLTLPNSLRVACTHLLVGFKEYYITSPCTIVNTRIATFIPWIEDIVWPDTEIVG